MHADKRRAGRAIRKQRRLEREAIATAMTWDFAPIVDAFAEFGRAVAEMVDHYMRVVEPMLVAAWEGWQSIVSRWEWQAAERHRREFEWRLAHRALTVGPMPMAGELERLLDARWLGPAHPLAPKPLCPECAQGKTSNCIGWTLDADDREVVCATAQGERESR